MTSYFSSLLTTTTSRVASIRQNLLPSENDGDTEDDTHVCRVLRAYYTEKGRSFPAWLPPDPKAPPPVVVQPVYAQSAVGSRYGGLQNQPGGASGGGLASLWDKQPQQQLQPQEQQSLRQGRGQGRMAASGRNPFANQNAGQAQQVVQSQPLPSRKEGSYQQTMFGRNDSTPPGSSGGPAPMSSRQRLAAHFNNKPGPPPNQRANSYESSGSAAPLTSANSPWSSSGGGYDAGGYDTGGYDAAPRNAGRQQGLPSGPGAGRRGPGLPSGPRGPR
ncbi:Sec1-binding region of Mso1-domain-containing protein [Rhexocercosporidium sp. MPI-PUGE-AT-0058]|nr:Sec1-binding region of Mso1-domain-containing protein [Rhexocercosporidium sp. MPI-PUGE-AT-0058]